MSTSINNSLPSTLKNSSKSARRSSKSPQSSPKVAPKQPQSHPKINPKQFNLNPILLKSKQTKLKHIVKMTSAIWPSTSPELTLNFPKVDLKLSQNIPRYMYCTNAFLGGAVGEGQQHPMRIRDAPYIHPNYLTYMWRIVEGQSFDKVNEHYCKTNIGNTYSKYAQQTS